MCVCLCPKRISLVNFRKDDEPQKKVWKRPEPREAPQPTTTSTSVSHNPPKPPRTFTHEPQQQQESPAKPPRANTKPPSPVREPSPVKIRQEERSAARATSEERHASTMTIQLSGSPAKKVEKREVVKTVSTKTEMSPSVRAHSVATPSSMRQNQEASPASKAVSSRKAMWEQRVQESKSLLCLFNHLFSASVHTCYTGTLKKLYIYTGLLMSSYAYPFEPKSSGMIEDKLTNLISNQQK